MRRGRIFFYLAAILILVMIASFAIYQRFMQPAQTNIEGVPEPTPIVDLVSVVVVTQPTPRGTVLDETVLGMVEIPRDVMFEGMFNDVALVVGRRAKFDLDSGIPLTASMLGDAAEQLSAHGSNAALAITRGKVAISVPINRLSSVSYALRPGDRVAVLATMLFVDLDSEFQSALPNRVGEVTGPSINPETGESTITIQVQGSEESGILGRTELDPILNELAYIVPSESQRARLVSQIVLYNVEVLHVGNFMLEEEEELGQAVAQPQEDVIAADNQNPEGTEEPVIQPPNVVTLIVDPQDAVALNYLMYSGAELTMVLRASGDDTVFTTEAATLQFLLDVYNIPAPAKLPYAIEPRIDELQSPDGDAIEEIAP